MPECLVYSQTECLTFLTCVKISIFAVSLLGFVSSFSYSY